MTTNPEMLIYCCNCKSDMTCSMVCGREVYSHLPHLHKLSFWKCSTCKQHVGCHKGTTTPLGCIPTPDLKYARRCIHELIDPLWKSGKIKRGKLYRELSKDLGYEYHTAEIRSIDEARKVYRIAKEIKNKIDK